MKREILFRGKRVDNGEWVYGQLIYSYEGVHIIESEYFKPSNEENPILIDVIHSTVGQFTGLLDKNGTKIFEGDQYQTDTWYGVTFTIKFVKGSFCVGTEENGYEPMGYSINQESETIEPDEFASTITITSNIHDNPTT